ncbi:MAG: hypothetical protein ABIH34_02265 [Nanoarchaeota archaeon]
MYNPPQGEEHHPGYEAKKYGAHAGTEDLLEKDHYHGQGKKERSYDPQHEYNPHGDDKVYHTGAGEDDETKDEKDSAFEELLQEEEKKAQEEPEDTPWFQSHAPDMDMPPQDQHAPRRRSVEEIISKAFNKKAKDGEGHND